VISLPPGRRPYGPEAVGSARGKISGHQQRWPRPLTGAILIPPALLEAADCV